MLKKVKYSSKDLLKYFSFIIRNLIIHKVHEHKRICWGECNFLNLLLNLKNKLVEFTFE